jgi:hypothetical protein
MSFEKEKIFEFASPRTIPKKRLTDLLPPFSPINFEDAD